MSNKHSVIKPTSPGFYLFSLFKMINLDLWNKAWVPSLKLGIWEGEKMQKGKELLEEKIGVSPLPSFAQLSPT